MTKIKPMAVRYYFVDEGGDSNLFAGRGKVLVGTTGCSRFFMLGLLDVPDPGTLEAGLRELRRRLQADPYFKNVPSMQAETRRTALAFHAKDDLPEVRREVYTVLKNTAGLRFFAVVKDKLEVVEYVRQRNESDPAYRYKPNELYDFLVRRLFKDHLHKDGGYEITFARRGKSDRTEALKEALQAARTRFTEKWGIPSEAPIKVIPGSPCDQAGLQAVDYFTWALQRVYETGEDRFLVFLGEAVCLVQDLDDRRKAGYGAYYTPKKPLDSAKLAWRK